MVFSSVEGGRAALFVASKSKHRTNELYIMKRGIALTKWMREDLISEFLGCKGTSGSFYP